MDNFYSKYINKLPKATMFMIRQKPLKLGHAADLSPDIWTGLLLATDVACWPCLIQKQVCPYTVYAKKLSFHRVHFKNSKHLPKLECELVFPLTRIDPLASTSLFRFWKWPFISTYFAFIYVTPKSFWYKLSASFKTLITKTKLITITLTKNTRQL